jgi:dephospho-CoA kinase
MQILSVEDMEMKTIGVTGGIGSGKTTVCRMLEDLGARVFYADLEARKLMEQDPARAEITAAFGPESYSEGRLNRSFVASKVFADPENVLRINRIVHPRVFEAFERAKEQAEQDGVSLLVKEAALIFESGGDKLLDAVVVVDAPEEVRISRVAERDQLTPEQVRARIRHQLSSEELRRRADYVLENTGSEANLRRQVDDLFARLTYRENTG